MLLLNQQKRNIDIANTLGVNRSSVWRIKKQYLEEGLKKTLFDKSRPRQPKKYTEKHAAEIIAMACIQPPEGRKRWSLVLLTEEMRKKEEFETINKESIRLILKKQN